MPDLALKNIPEQIYRRLEEAAARHARAIEEEAAQRIADSLDVPEPETSKPSIDELLQTAKKIRGQQQHAWLTPEFISEAREEGRP